MELQHEKGWKAVRFLPTAVRCVGSRFSKKIRREKREGKAAC